MGHPKITEKTGIGMKRVTTPHPADCICKGCVRPKSPWKHLPKRMKKVGDTKRGQEQKIFPYMRELIAQEISGIINKPKGIILRDMELDHIRGRNFPGLGRLGAMLSPMNLQFLDQEDHAEKTNAPTRAGQRRDYRTLEVKTRMAIIELEILKRLGPVWDLKDLKRVVQSMIWME